MYAYELQGVLGSLMGKSDFHSSEDREMEKRFAALRGYGHLPKGREHRGRRLTLDQVGHAVLGLVTRYPAWAGHSATCLHSLVPVGGIAAAPFGSPNLLAAIRHLLSHDDARSKLVRLTVTGAEAGVNSHGHAELIFRDEEGLHRSAYVHRLTLSSQAPSAEQTYLFDARWPAASREISFSPEFFDEIAGEYDLSVRINRPPKSDGSEYDPEEALKAFYDSLGAKPRSRYLNVGVEATIGWPKQPSAFEFGNVTLVAL